MHTGSWVNSQSDFPSLVICAAENSIQIFLVWTLAFIFLVSKISILVVVFGIVRSRWSSSSWWSNWWKNHLHLTCRWSNCCLIVVCTGVVIMEKSDSCCGLFDRYPVCLYLSRWRKRKSLLATWPLCGIKIFQNLIVNLWFFGMWYREISSVRNAAVLNSIRLRGQVQGEFQWIYIQDVILEGCIDIRPYQSFDSLQNKNIFVSNRSVIWTRKKTNNMSIENKLLWEKISRKIVIWIKTYIATNFILGFKVWKLCDFILNLLD